MERIRPSNAFNLLLFMFAFYLIFKCVKTQKSLLHIHGQLENRGWGE